MFHCASGSVSTFFSFFTGKKIGWRSLSLVSFSIQCCAPTVRRMKAAFSVCVGKWRIDRSAPLPAAGSRTINTGPGVRGLHCLYNVESIYQAVCIGFGSREIKQNKEVCLVRRRRKSHLGRLLRKAISCSPRSYIRRAKYVYRLSFLVCGGESLSYLNCISMPSSAASPFSFFQKFSISHSQRQTITTRLFFFLLNR